MQRFSKWASREYPLALRIAALSLAGVLFLCLLPLAIVRGGSLLDHRLGLSALDLGVTNFVLGGALIAAGGFFALWSIMDQITRGRGTPLPVMPTQELLTQGPFRYCRNPMTLGTILAYLGLGLAARTLSGMGLVVCFGAVLLLYLNGVEEKELAARFGEPYLAYQREVPFLIPKLPRRR